MPLIFDESHSSLYGGFLMKDSMVARLFPSIRRKHWRCLPCYLNVWNKIRNSPPPTCIYGECIHSWSNNWYIQILFYFVLKFFFNWKIIALQSCIGFCWQQHTSAIRVFMCVSPFPLEPPSHPHIPPLWVLSPPPAPPSHSPIPPLWVVTEDQAGRPELQSSFPLFLIGTL